jgi:hypothetical protein
MAVELESTDAPRERAQQNLRLEAATPGTERLPIL